MPDRFDVIIIGLGAMGSAAAFHLAKSGQRILGLDRFKPPHTLGSSHGQTRIIREAYFEHPVYVPIIQRAYELWSEMEAESGMQLLLKTGGLMIGPPDGPVVSGARRSAEEHGLKHEVLTSAQVHARFPALHPAPEMVAVWEPRAGILFPEDCIEAHLQLAARAGACLRYGENVLDWKPDGEGVRVRTKGGEYQAAQLLLSLGGWLSSLLPERPLPLQVERQILFWFEPATEFADRFHPHRCPIHIWEYEPRRYFYGFPDLGRGVKVARHHEGQNTEPDLICRDISAQEIEAMRQIVQRHLPRADGPLKTATVCHYTNTPDGHFLIDRHPLHPQVLVASPCSGHGFKFASAIGEILSHLLSGKPCQFDLSLFRYGRFDPS